MSVKITLDASSLSHVTNKLQQKEVEVRMSGRNAVAEAAELIFAKAQAKVPRRTGALADSGKITNTTTRPDIIKSTISYGDATINPKTREATRDYAVMRHEQPDNPGYKWLENAMIDSMEQYQATIARRLSKVL